MKPPVYFPSHGHVCSPHDPRRRRLFGLSVVAGTDRGLCARRRSPLHDAVQAEALVGGKLHFIVKHMLVGRVEILRFDDRDDGRVDIVCVADLERVHPTPKRAHQGWRYLAAADAPQAIDDNSADGDLPPELYRELAELSLI